MFMLMTLNYISHLNVKCQSISGKLDFVFDHIKEYQLDIVALTETWLSSEDSKNKHVID